MEYLNLGVSFFISILANVVTPEVQKVVKKLKTSKTFSEKKKAISEAKGIIELAVSNGTIHLEKAELEALKSIQCDHGSGQLIIDQAKLKAATLSIGGQESHSSGSTVITESELESKGAKTSVSSDGSITITGNASMKQS